MSNYDPVDYNILSKVLKKDYEYIRHNRWIFNQINSYLRPQANSKYISTDLIRIGDVKNDYNERFMSPSIDNAYKVHEKFLNKGIKVVDMEDYKKKYEPEAEKKEAPEVIQEKLEEAGKEIQENKENLNEQQAEIMAKEKGEEVEGAGLKSFMKKGRGVKAVGNKTIPKASFIGLDIGNEFKPNMMKKGRGRPKKVGGARTMFQDPVTMKTKLINKKKVQDMKNYINNNILDKIENIESNKQAKSMTGAVVNVSKPVRKIGGAKKARSVSPKKIGGGRAAYQAKLKEIRAKHNCSLKDAMKIYSQSKK